MDVYHWLLGIIIIALVIVIVCDSYLLNVYRRVTDSYKETCQLWERTCIGYKMMYEELFQSYQGVTDIVEQVKGDYEEMVSKFGEIPDREEQDQ